MSVWLNDTDVRSGVVRGVLFCEGWLGECCGGEPNGFVVYGSGSVNGGGRFFREGVGSGNVCETG